MKEYITKNMRLSEIRISDEMMASMPRPDKIKDKYEHFRTMTLINRRHNTENDVFQSKIIVNKENILIDGYISYLLAKMFDVKNVDVLYEQNY